MPEPMTDERLAEIRERADRATPGPWGFGGAGVASDERMICRTNLESDAALERCDSSGFLSELRQDGTNGEFIAHARIDIPALLAEVDRLRAEMTRDDGLKGWTA